MLSASDLLRGSINLYEEPNQSNQTTSVDEPNNSLRQLLLTMNTTTLVTANMKFAISIYLVFWTKMFWWGISYLLMSICSIAVSLIYFPLIWKSVRLNAVKFVLICLIISHFIDAGFTLSHVVRNHRKTDDTEYKTYIWIKGFHLGVVFSSFTYYWRLYSLSLLAGTIFERRRSTVQFIN